MIRFFNIIKKSFKTCFNQEEPEEIEEVNKIEDNNSTIVNDEIKTDIKIKISEHIKKSNERKPFIYVNWFLPNQKDVYYRNNEIYQKFYLGNNFYINDCGLKRIVFANWRETLKFPINGWFQECIVCYTPTGHNYIIKGIVPKNIYVHICNKCRCKLEYFRKIQSPKYYDFIDEVNDALQYLNKGRRYINY